MSSKNINEEYNSSPADKLTIVSPSSINNDSINPASASSISTVSVPASSIPERPTIEGIEQKWSERWEKDGIYRFDRTKTRDEVFSIDTPPPTVSGSLHVGHIFSYTHTDTIARFWRMNGKTVFYPMGWDDNGLPTERRVQNYFGITCDPSLPYDPAFIPPQPLKKKGERPNMPVSRQNFIDTCQQLVIEDEKVFEKLWKSLGLSVDWSMTYTTVGERSRKVSQRAFLKELKAGIAYRSEAPTIWDVDFQTAVAQAELTDKEVSGAYHKLAFHGSNGDVHIETTRPELLAACVALVAHPDDERYKPLFGQEVTTPLFGVKVPILSHRLADPAKGSGIAMICTFGDVTDVIWWRELKLPMRTIIRSDGRLGNLDFSTLPTDKAEEAQELYNVLVGKKSAQAQTKIVELLRESNELIGDPRPIKHMVKFYEKGDRPLEILSSRQWFIKTMDYKEQLLARGAELKWHPPYMKARFDDWVNGLNSDWLISRQRFFGVPFPVWYKIDNDGVVHYDEMILPNESDLPIDPSSDVPSGYNADQRNCPNGFAGDTDIMDTWATSSLTPQIACGWVDDDELFSKTYPMDMRPQAHDIIRTWLFSTIVRGEFETNTLPWKNAALSGWILDPDRKKMSKSIGNVVTPAEFLEEYGSDAVRYWAANARPGVDTAFEISQMKVGRRLATKLLNASKFVLSFPEPGQLGFGKSIKPTLPIDLALIPSLKKLVENATDSFLSFDYARALEQTETEFWFFCDHYLELAKARAYGSQGEEAAASANATLRFALSIFQRLFAPFLPFTTEEIWSWWNNSSVHLAPWPCLDEFNSIEENSSDVLSHAKEVLSEIRRAKSEAEVSQRSTVALCKVFGSAYLLASVKAAEGDLKDAGSIESLELVEKDAFSVEVVLAQQ